MVADRAFGWEICQSSFVISFVMLSSMQLSYNNNICHYVCCRMQAGYGVTLYDVTPPQATIKINGGMVDGMVEWREW